MPDGGLYFQVAGVPRAQPRGRHVGGRVISTTGPAKTWRAQVKAAAMAAIDAAIADGRRMPLAGAVEFRLAVRFPTPDTRRWGDWRTATRDRDADNLAKLAMDAAVDAGALADDGQVARLVVEAVWCRPEAAGVSVSLMPLRARESASERDATPGWLG